MKGDNMQFQSRSPEFIGYSLELSGTLFYDSPCREELPLRRLWCDETLVWLLCEESPW